MVVPLSPLQHLVACFSWKDAVWQFTLGISVGSFLNVLALRTLAERNPFWGHSRCTHCDRNISFFDLVPIVSYLLLKGRCRFCQERISWQYPFVELITGIMFVIVMQSFGSDISMLFRPGDVLEGIQFNSRGWAMSIFVSIMIVLCITDFREKLLPHEITYPSMLVGLLYSAYTREDGLMNCLAGIGISYIVFDFLAFYGLILYRMTNKEELNESGEESDLDAVEKQSWWQSFFQWQTESPKQTESHRQSDASRQSDVPEQSESPERAAISQQSNPTSEQSSSSDNVNAAPNQQASDQPSAEQSPVAAEHAVESGFRARDDREVDSINLAQGAPIKFASRVPINNGEANDRNHGDDNVDPFIDQIFNVKIEEAEIEGEDPDDFEVMGGGDAVLAAVIAAWLGLSGLGFTLLGGFMIGTLMGAGYLLHEMHLHGSLKQALTKIGIWCAGLLLLSEGCLVVLYETRWKGDLSDFFERMESAPYVAAAISLFVGTLLGIIATGRKYSKPFPFGPALALAAVISIFWNPGTPTGVLPGR